MRAYTENRFKDNEETVEQHKADNEDQFSFMFRKNDELTAYIKTVEDTNSAHRKKYIEMNEVSLRDLVPNLTAADVEPDTEG